MTQKITNFINQLRDYSNNAGVSIKHACLLLIAIVSLLLIVFGRNGFDFGVVALACWIFAFLDLARIKFKDYEIDFMTRKQALTADERKLFEENLKQVQQFHFDYLQNHCVTFEALIVLINAGGQANFCMPKEIVDYLTKLVLTAMKSYFIRLKIDDAKGFEKEELIKEEKKINELFENMKPFDIYRKYAKVIVDEED